MSAINCDHAAGRTYSVYCHLRRIMQMYDDASFIFRADCCDVNLCSINFFIGRDVLVLKDASEVWLLTGTPFSVSRHVYFV